MAGGDDSVLTRVVRFFEGKGLEVRGVHEVAPDLLAGAGPMGGVALAAARSRRRGARLCRAARARRPSTPARPWSWRGGKVLAIEGAEGTDAMLQRVAALASARRGRRAARACSPKGPKPGQELRVDMPAIGPRTIEQAAAAGLAGVVVEAGAVLVLDRAEAIAHRRRARLRRLRPRRLGRGRRALPPRPRVAGSDG